ncbi:F0F1 ATP synthase subunit epsilon [Pseudothermotoga thermarum]|uniref:ATP synthase epsilon chain n=1 Tax=Pseudothermotoga thermarum DSM 5069 TaxID=688269 RepID=F7YV86_9THEM|nr:ATP synthase F1 subunit epsilon [Pseudothermotoga thermarum]AEH50385.1 ATP synthase F1, epsilon subunit [Pseudothermotoga thermarum DSM 5069]
MIEVEILSPTSVCWKGKTSFVLVRTVVGAMGILPRRAPIVAQLAVDYVRCVTENGEKVFATYGGYMSCDGESKITIVASVVVPAEELDPHVFKDARERAEKLMEFEKKLYKNAKVEVDVKKGK